MSVNGMGVKLLGVCFAGCESDRCECVDVKVIGVNVLPVVVGLGIGLNLHSRDLAVGLLVVEVEDLERDAPGPAQRHKDLHQFDNQLAVVSAALDGHQIFGLQLVIDSRQLAIGAKQEDVDVETVVVRRMTPDLSTTLCADITDTETENKTL